MKKPRGINILNIRKQARQSSLVLQSQYESSIIQQAATAALTSNGGSEEANKTKEMFPEYAEVREQEVHRLTQWHNQLASNEFQDRFVPMFRYIPNRLTMQRIIMRAAMLSAEEKFVKF